MDPLIPPFNIFIQIDGRRYQAAEYSEAGLTLPAEILLNGGFQDLRRGAERRLMVNLSAEDSSDMYEVRVRLARLTPMGVELAFVEMPAQLRLRLRHAGHTSASLRDNLDDQAAAEALSISNPSSFPGAGLSGRRLILPGSAAVWGATQERQQAIRRRPPSEALSQPAIPRQSAVDATIAARAYLQGALAVLIGSTLVIILLAAMIIIG